MISLVRLRSYPFHLIMVIKVKIWLWIDTDLFGKFDCVISWELDVISHRRHHCFVMEPKMMLINDVGF